MATKTRQLADFLVTGGVSDAEIQSVPHIRPGVLQPAVAGKLLDGTTSHSGAYGTAQSDGHSYYYTDIKGSKPIKDPRIGAHFGSHRHNTKSLQLLEQETAINGINVYSIDGREWARAYGSNITVTNNPRGNCLTLAKTTTDTNFIEIVGYWNSVNISKFTAADNHEIRVSLNGGTVQETDYGNGLDSPLYGRYVDSSSVHAVTFNSTPTLGINTIKLLNKTADETNLHNFELIAQDTSSDANKVKIQIPSQNVVSYGKKFTVSGTPHYDPFNGFTNGTTLFSANVDTATSLGLGTGTIYGAPWAISSSNHIRPFNGGRVVKWVDSSGAIKTSVTMMPANAQSLKTTASNEITTASATNTHTINFSDDAIENSLSEVAKSWLPREFGNGSANEGHNGTWQDFTMTDDDGSQNIDYAMDDSGTNNLRMYEGYFTASSECLVPGGNGSYSVLEFIGTGVGLRLDNDGRKILAQNLPYGTHILKIKRDADTSPVITLDGITVYDAGTSSASYYEIDIFQPKKPPVPEDSCILADYMLMADYVKNTTANSQHDKYISKGVRRVSCSRDIWYNKTANGWSLSRDHFQNTGFTVALDTTNGAAARLQAHLPAFATQIEASGFGDRRQLYVDSGSAEAQTVTGASYDAQTVMNTAKVLGTYTFKSHSKVDTTGTISSIDVVTPIHTSHHYQPFESPWLYDLVGGDRNMEQTNLVVTPDGKTWDEVTRDTSYIGNSVLSTTIDHNQDVKDAVILMEEWRGNFSQYTVPSFNKDFAIRYNKITCLRDGWYEIYAQQPSNDSLNAWSYFWLVFNGDPISRQMMVDADWDMGSVRTDLLLKRGDTLHMAGMAHTNEFQFQIKRLR